MDWDLHLLVKSETLPLLRLDGEQQLGRSACLGRPQEQEMTLVVGASRLAEAERRQMAAGA